MVLVTQLIASPAACPTSSTAATLKALEERITRIEHELGL